MGDDELASQPTISMNVKETDQAAAEEKHQQEVACKPKTQTVRLTHIRASDDQ